MSPHKQAEKELRNAGFIRHRTTGKHDVWRDPQSGKIIPLRRGSNFDEDDLRTIRAEINAIKRGRN